MYFQTYEWIVKPNFLSYFIIINYKSFMTKPTNRK